MAREGTSESAISDASELPYLAAEPLPVLNVIGLMSGTSVDSVDAALCAIGPAPDKTRRLMAELIRFESIDFPTALRSRVFKLFEDGPGTLSLLCSVNFEIGELLADAALRVLDFARKVGKNVRAIASHGQTMYHVAPHMTDAANGLRASTLQIGSPAVLAERTGHTVVSDFRSADMAVGGNGAPLVPFADWHLFSRPDRGVVVLNLGGIANLTLLPAGGSLRDVVAFDTGPSNMMMDAFVAHFYPGEECDRDGLHARAGHVIEPLLARWMAIPYIAAPPPKSTGRELFGVQMAKTAITDFSDRSPDDLIATATEFAALSFAQNMKSFVLPLSPVAGILAAGGGAYNPFLLERIDRALKDLCGAAAPVVRRLDDTGWNSKAREAVAFAMLGYARLVGIPGNVPSATGATRPVLLGSLTDPTVCVPPIATT